MTFNEPLLSTREAESQNNQFIMGIHVDELVRFNFLERSAQYFGVYCESDPFETTADEHLIN